MIIKADKKGNKGLAVFGFCMALFFFLIAALGIFATFSGEAENPLLDILLSFLCAFCASFILWAAIYLLRESKSDKPLIEITDTYFYDNSSAIALGRIPWSDMERVYFKGLFLNIKLRDPDVYLSRKNAISRLLIKINCLLGYGEVTVSPHQRFPKQADAFYDAFFAHRLPDEE